MEGRAESEVFIVMPDFEPGIPCAVNRKICLPHRKTQSTAQAFNKEQTPERDA